MTDRQITLMELLSTQVRPAKYYADELNVSVRTIHNDLNVIEEELSYKGIRLLKVPGQGIYIDKEKENYDLELSNGNISPYTRQFEIFKDLLINRTKVSYEKLSEQYYVSQSSIRNDINIIEKTYLNEITLKLIRDRSGTYLDGSYSELLETHILFCQYIYLNIRKISFHKSFYELYSEIYGKELLEDCMNIIESVEKNNIIFIGDHYRTNLLIILISMIHLKSNDESDEIIEVDEEVKIGYDSHIFFAQTIVSKISELRDVEFNNGDILYLVKFLRGIRLELNANVDTMNNNSDELGPRIVDTICEKLKIDLTISDSIKNQLIIHVNSMLYRIENNIIIKNDLTDKIQQEYKVLFNSLWLILNEEINKKFPNKSVSSHEVAFIVIYLQTLLSKQSNNKRILVVCPNGMSTSQFIVNRLREFLPPFDAIEVTSINNLSSLKYEDFDLIVSTTEHIKKSDNVVVVSPIFNNNDIIEVSRIYNSFISNKDKNQVRNYTKIIELINPDYIEIIDKTNLSKDELIDKVITKYIELGKVTEEYLQAVFTRETLGSTLINEDSAFPHGSPSFVKESMLGFVIIKEKIKWDDSQIRFIFFPCIAEKDINIVRELFTELYELISDKEILLEMLNTKNSEEIIEILKEK